MNILLISQCRGRALKETRRILDQFAERKGARTWQTPITQQGLLTLKKLLCKTARRNTAVCCQWIKKANYSEVLWIVGNPAQFNLEGSVPTNLTQRDILREDSENNWHTLQNMTFLSALAGLFHDLGKANHLFQKKLTDSSQPIKDPIRHEWVSLRLFCAFVNKRPLSEWLTALAQITPAQQDSILKNLIKDGCVSSPENPFSTLVDDATRLTGWLIVSHHFLPTPKSTAEPKVDRLNKWLDTRLTYHWNSQPQENIEQKTYQQNWDFSEYQTPFASNTWCNAAQSLAQRIIDHQGLTQINFDDNYTRHLARLCLMLADHCYSAQGETQKWQDPNYHAIANTEYDDQKQKRKPKQRLDEHNIGVSRYAAKFSRQLPHMLNELPPLEMGTKAFRKRTPHRDFQWQNKAYELACSIQERANTNGFFGVNMASTGCGKTLANARIMYALADKKRGCRFNIALGLRTLTLQTADALRQRLHLNDDELAVFIGSDAIKKLHQNQKSGSTSEQALLDNHYFVHYEGQIKQGLLANWLKRSTKLQKLLTAPIVVSTIDQIIPATEGVRGGKQIAPMLRLLTSDLILDEPDDFGIEDIPALSRLVYFAGMLGSKVLLSSATLPPKLIEALFIAYCEGRKQFQQARFPHERGLGICCGWFDEKQKPQFLQTNNPTCLMQQHSLFVQKRVKFIQSLPNLRPGQLITLPPIPKKTLYQDVAEVLLPKITMLHDQHHQSHQGKTLSIGLVRMANIDPMIAVSQAMLTMPVPDNYQLHYCIYHSQHPLVIRSAIEHNLDALLARHEPNTLWQHSLIKTMLRSNITHHIILVFATAVAEVGRDHDYDWAIAEPSSMRSLIQLAGRVQRHRKQTPKTPNLLILNKNIRVLDGKEQAYCKPGFENCELQLENKDLHQALAEDQIQSINAIARIIYRSPLKLQKKLLRA